MIETIQAVGCWGSVLSSLLLSMFMFVQAVMNRDRRFSLAAFGVTWACIGLIDGLFSSKMVDYLTYEKLRILWCGLYVSALIGLMQYRIAWAWVALFGLPLLGAAAWIGWKPQVATTFTFPVAFFTASLIHAKRFIEKRGYSSSVLSAYYAAMGLECCVYYLIVDSGKISDMFAGYLHYALLGILAVMFGWIHLPRELTGRSPVRVEVPHAVALFIAVLVGESVFVISLMVSSTAFEIAGTAFIVVSTLAMFFYHRHRLVIFAENVSALLDERTASLRAAQEELAKQNERQAERLREQERELRSKAEVIERQRRLELAAQTAGQTAHDIQNIVSPILVHLERLKSDDVPVIRKQVEHLLEVNGQLLALARRGRLEKVPVRLDELAADLRDHFPGKPVTVDGPSPVWVQGSWSQITRALTNLVINGLESERDRETAVTVRVRLEEAVETRRCTLGYVKPGRYAVVEIADDGPGIPEAIRDKIFEPFFSSKRGKGSGLGLTIVAAVVDDHEGALDLQTGPEGTRVTLHLPAIDAPQISEASLTGEGTVLIVDDDPIVVRRYGTMLRDAGYAVLQATSAARALEVLQVQTADVILLDLKMPQVSGVRALMGALHLRPGLRAVVHSSFIDEAAEKELRRLGVDSFLQKPASRREVLEAIRSATRQKSSVQ